MSSLQESLGSEKLQGLFDYSVSLRCHKSDHRDSFPTQARRECSNACWQTSPLSHMPRRNSRPKFAADVLGQKISLSWQSLPYSDHLF